MPELPEIETICTGLQSLKNERITKVFRSQKTLRIPSSLDLQEMVGAEFLKISRKARYLIFDLSNKKSLVMHLGMSGRVILEKKFYQLKHDHFSCELSGGSCLTFNDTRRFGFVDLVESNKLQYHKMLCNLGCEPLSPGFNFSYLREKLQDKRMNIKTSMMDNKIVVGVGNIYISESLFDAKISPLQSACDLRDNELKRLVASIKKILAQAIESGGSSISDYVDSNGKSGKFQNKFKVYGRDGLVCTSCDGLIQKIIQNGRSSFYCKKCQ